MERTIRRALVILRGNSVGRSIFENVHSFRKYGSSSTSAVVKGPLDGIRVLDLTRIVAGPYCTMILGDMGADIIKVENPDGGDESRKWGPPYVNGTSETCYFACLNRNKRSICVDFKKREGVVIVKELAGHCDVIIENYVPGKLDSIGLGYEALKNIHPKLVYCSLTGYGPAGPYRNRPGYDVIAASLGGFMHITGPQGGEPCKAGVAMTDIATGLYAHGAILAALYQRQSTGKGQKIDCNLLSTQLACLINIGGNYLNAGQEGLRWGSAHASIVPYRAYLTADKRYITVGTGSDRQFQDLCERLSLPGVAEDPRFATNNERVKNRAILDAILEDRFKTKTMIKWAEELSDASFPNGPVNNLEEAFANEHVKATGVVQTVQHPTAGQVNMVGPAVGFSDAPSQIRLPPPMLGQHTRQVLQQLLKLSNSEVNGLSKRLEIPVRLKLEKPKPDKKVNWTEGTVDNEHLNKKKSKCCCIYKKPRAHLDSSSDDDDLDCEDCRGHVEKRACSNVPTSNPETPSS